MMLKKVTWLLLLASIGPAAAADNDTAVSPDSVLAEVVNLALKYMGLESKADLKPAIELITVSPDSDPFRSEKYSGRRVWHVRIDSLVLRMDYKKRLGLVQEPRPFDIFIDSVSQRLLKIVSRNSSYSDSTVEKPGLVDAELLWQMPCGEADDPPAQIPTISFVEAVNLAKNSDAPEIVGLCRMIGSPEEPNPRPGWLIHCYGLPRRMTVSDNRSIPGPQGTHTRTVISTVSGDFVLQDLPAPLPPQERNK